MASLLPSVTPHFTLFHFLRYLSGSVNLVLVLYPSPPAPSPQKQGCISLAQCYMEQRLALGNTYLLDE